MFEQQIPGSGEISKREAFTPAVGLPRGVGKGAAREQLERMTGYCVKEFTIRQLRLMCVAVGILPAVKLGF